MPTSTGYEIASDKSYDWDGRKRGTTPFAIIQHTLGGQGRLRYERRMSRVDIGETMLVIIPHNHRYWVEDGDLWEFFWIAITGREALRVLSAILAAAGPLFRLHADTIEKLAGISLSLREPSKDGERAGNASSRGYEATMALYDDLLGGHEQPRHSQGRPEVLRVVSHVRSNLDKPLDVGQLSDMACLSRAHFSRIFTECEGISPAAFILAERMRRAARLLVNTSSSVKDVAGACGFEDPNYFAKAFRRSYGISPTEFRTTGMYASPGSASKKSSA